MFSYQSSERCLATAILDYHICSSVSSTFSSFFQFSDPASRSLYPGSARARHLHLMFCSDTYQRNVLYHIICAYKCQLLFSTFFIFLKLVIRTVEILKICRNFARRRFSVFQDIWHLAKNGDLSVYAVKNSASHESELYFGIITFFFIYTIRLSQLNTSRNILTQRKFY